MRMNKRGEWFYEESDVDMYRVRETTSRLGRSLPNKGVGPRSPQQGRVAQAAERPVDHKSSGMAPVVDGEVAGSSPAPATRPRAQRHLNDYGPHDESTAPQTVKVNAHRKTRDLIDEPMPEKARALRRFINTRAHLEAVARRTNIG